MEASSLNAPPPPLRASHLVIVSGWAHISIPLASFPLSLSVYSPPPWEWRGQRGEAQAPVKWLYRGETRAGGGPRLKAEWQAAEAIKIEPLSLAARARLIQAGAQAALFYTHTQHTHTHLLSSGTWTDMRWHGCRHVRVHLHLQATLSLSLSPCVCLESFPCSKPINPCLCKGEKKRNR